MNRQKSLFIEIELIDGETYGMRVITVPNWSGKGIFIPRTELQTALKSMNDLQNPGVYVLRQLSTKGELPKIYVGQSQDVSKRLQRHSQSSTQIQEWSDCVVFVEERKNQSQIRYIESRLIEFAEKAKRCHVVNKRGNKESSSDPHRCSITDKDRITADEFLKTVIQCLTVIGFDFFIEPPIREKRRSQDMFLLKVPEVAGTAEGVPQGNQFVVLKGSVVRPKETPKCDRVYKDLRKELRKLGVISQSGGLMRFTQDYPFDSPTAAGAVVLGRNCRGPIEWKHHKTGKPLAEFWGKSSR